MASHFASFFLFLFHLQILFLRHYATCQHRCLRQGPWVVARKPFRVWASIWIASHELSCRSCSVPGPHRKLASMFLQPSFSDRSQLFDLILQLLPQLSLLHISSGRFLQLSSDTFQLFFCLCNKLVVFLLDFHFFASARLVDSGVFCGPVLHPCMLGQQLLFSFRTFRNFLKELCQKPSNGVS